MLITTNVDACWHDDRFKRALSLPCLNLQSATKIARTTSHQAALLCFKILGDSITMSNKIVNILVVGLNYNAASRLNPSLTKESFAKIVSSMDKLDGKPGLKIRVAAIDPELKEDDADSVPSLLRTIESGPQQGEHWSAVLIGSGVRLLPPMVPVLENIVNTTSSSSEGRIKILFSTDAVDHGVVIKRGFPGLL
ncbi:hypothetical protein MRB53_040076 [Persea americana]|nr:hypothetical protein MRB53_040076 [Persea americana]